MTPPQGQRGSLLGPGGAARRVFVLVAALLMMWGLHALRLDADSGAVDAMTLAAAGFVLLTAFTVGELGGALGLPKVTGYIVAGAVLGPQVSDILSGRVVDELGTFNTLALGLIATTAGLELHLPAIRRVARTLSATVLLKILLLPVLVGLPFVLSQLVWPSFDLPGWPGLLAMGLIISVLGLGTSPAIALAVANDTGAKGRLTDLLLGIAVVKDVVVVTCLAVSVAIAHALLSGGGLDTHVLLHLGGELAASVGVGAVVGVVLILYLRFVQAELLFATLVMVLVVAELSHVLHLELLLVFIVAGFVVRNFSRLEHALLEPLERISLPVFVVFFTTAGAGIDLRGTMAILPLAVGLVACRAGAYWLAARLGARLGSEDAPVARNAWLTYLPQAGVTLGLVLLAADALPELSGPITRLGMALVALNLLVGPVTLALGLKGAGETAASRAIQPSGSTASSERDVDGELHGSGAGADAGAALGGPGAGEQDPVALVEALASPELADLVRQLQGDLEASISGVVAASIAPRAARRAEWAAPLLEPAETRHTTLRRIRLGLETMPQDPEGSWERELAALYDQLDERIQALPVWLEVPLEPELLEPAVGDGPALRLRRGVARLAARWERRKGRVVLRRVPVRQALRVSLEPRLAEAIASVGASWHRSSAELSAGMRLLAKTGQAGSLPAMGERGALWYERAQADLLFAMLAGLREAVPRLSLLGSPSMPASTIRYAEVEPRVATALERLVADGPAWRERVSASLDTTRAVVHVELYVLALGGSLEARVRDPLTAVRQALLPELRQRAERFEALATEAGELGLDEAQLQRMAAGAEALLGRGRSSALRRARGRFRRAVQPGPLLGDMADLSRNAPELLRVVAQRTPVERAARPQDVLIWEVAFGRAIDGLLHDGLLPSVGALLGPASELVAAADSRVRDAVSVATYGVDLAARGGFEGEQAQREVLVDSLRRAARRVEQLHTELIDALDEAESSLDQLLQDSSQGLRDLLNEQAQRPAARVRTTLVAVQQALMEAGGRAGALLRGWYARLGLAARQLAQQQAVRDLRIRSGHERLDATAIAAYLDEAWPTAEAPQHPRGLRAAAGPHAGGGAAALRGPRRHPRAAARRRVGEAPAPGAVHAARGSPGRGPQLPAEHGAAAAVGAPGAVAGRDLRQPGRGSGARPRGGAGHGPQPRRGGGRAAAQPGGGVAGRPGVLAPARPTGRRRPRGAAARCGRQRAWGALGGERRRGGLHPARGAVAAAPGLPPRPAAGPGELAGASGDRGPAGAAGGLRHPVRASRRPGRPAAAPAQRPREGALLPQPGSDLRGQPGHRLRRAPAGLARAGRGAPACGNAGPSIPPLPAVDERGAAGVAGSSGVLRAHGASGAGGGPRPRRPRHRVAAALPAARGAGGPGPGRHPQVLREPAPGPRPPARAARAAHPARR
jgi:Kef-type K+ transport system membrane component KefB